MAGSSADPTQQLNDYIRTTHDQGILGDNFDQLLTIRRQQNPQFLNEMISMFIHDAQAYFVEITNALSLTEVEFSTIISKIHQLKGSTSSIGGHRMYQACSELSAAAHDGDKVRCDELFLRLKEEFNTLKQCFDSISQMRRNIIISSSNSNVTKRRRRRPL